MAAMAGIGVAPVAVMEVYRLAYERALAAARPSLLEILQRDPLN
jgi:hypothetical protein